MKESEDKFLQLLYKVGYNFIKFVFNQPTHRSIFTVNTVSRFFDRLIASYKFINGYELDPDELEFVDELNIDPEINYKERYKEKTLNE